MDCSAAEAWATSTPAYDPELDRKIDVKLVRAQVDKRMSVSDGRSRLLREAQAIAKLSHPNVVV